VSVIPIVTVIHDLFAGMKGPYYRLVGRYTQRYLSRGSQQSGNEQQRRVLFVAAAGMDELFSTIFAVKAQCGILLARTAVEKKVTKKQLNTAFRVYLSALLISLGSGKVQVLHELDCKEAEWLKLWRTVFEYQPEDSRQFNEVLLPAYQQGGIEKVIAAADGLLQEVAAFAASEMLHEKEPVIRAALLQDLAAIYRTLGLKPGA
jgi:hypothetical protein